MQLDFATLCNHTEPCIEGIDKYDGGVGDLEIGFASFYLMLIRMEIWQVDICIYR